MTRFTLEELRKEAEREVAMRKHVYRGILQAGGVDAKTLQLRIDKMQAIADHFRQLENERERLL